MKEYELELHITLNNDNYTDDNITKVDVVAYPAKYLKWLDDSKTFKKDAKYVHSSDGATEKQILPLYF